MSGWTFNCKVDVSRLLEMQARLGMVPSLLGEVTEQVAEKVKENIQQKNIIDTGALLDSIQSESKDNYATVHDGVSYGIYNEFGTYKMAARPFFIPAVEKAAPLIEQKFLEIFR